MERAAMTEQPGAPDRVIARVHALTTTFLDTLAILLFAGGSLAWGWLASSLPFGLLGAGMVIGLASAVAQRQPRAPKAEASVKPKPLPGPSDPGTVHFAGGE